MWAFSIWDKDERSLFLARDRYGKKPLFYTFLQSGDFAFASEMKALLPLLDSVQPNVGLIRDHARIFHYEQTDECVIEGIKRFPAGHYAYYQNKKLGIKKWWATLDHLPDIPARYEEQVEQFRELFLDSCRLRMRSDVPIGTALSGGLDSSATISCMAHLSKNIFNERRGKSWQHAFVASFPGTPLDETKYAKIVTDHIGIDATFLVIDPVKAIGSMDRYFYLFEDLNVTSPIPFMLTYEAVKSHGISVTLDGHGADELFGGYNFDYIIALQDAGLNLSKARQVLDAYYSSWPEKSSQFREMPSKSAFWIKWQAKMGIRKFLSDLIHNLKNQSENTALRSLDHLSRQLYISTHETILPTLLRNYDRYSMANGVEIRMPFMDHRLATFAFSLPWDSKIRKGFAKAVIRDAVAPYLPHEIAYRKSKIGFNSPIVDWMKGPLKEFILDTIHSNAFNTCSLIDPEKVSQAVKKVISDPDAKFSEGERAWTLLSPCLWERGLLHYKPTEGTGK